MQTIEIESDLYSLERTINLDNLYIIGINKYQREL